MGNVRPITPPTAMAIGPAISAYLATLSGPEQRGTRTVYRSTLRALAAEMSTGNSAGFPTAEFDTEASVERLTDWFTTRWANRAPATWNRNLDAVRAATRYWMDQGWISSDPSRRLRRRGRAPDRTRALPRGDVEDFLAREDLELRLKVLARMLYETAARASEVLALDIEEVDLRNRCAKVRRKGNAVDVIVWQTGTARLLPRLIGGRKKGPLFLTDRKARVPLAAADLDPATGKARLSYRRAAELFTAATAACPGGPWTLHQLRHSALTHAAEDGANTSTLLAFSGHTNVASLARYARVSAEALTRWQHQRDPHRRR
ncbi:integrase/recombinase XerD [Thermomonospora echinospora]|uniref:Integrase/recombinase XerD n=1 Tax=Thermomonospora echinospora TaxID=1992 RepID=A0A1H6EAD9_9ACTN|nr:integrase/recombinase XerD [Thermomonospora echinospora]